MVGCEERRERENVPGIPDYFVSFRFSEAVVFGCCELIVRVWLASKIKPEEQKPPRSQG